jgi:hypothetical protein
MSTNINSDNGTVRTGKPSKLEKATRPRKSKIAKGDQIVQTDPTNIPTTTQEHFSAVFAKHNRTNWEAFKATATVNGIKFKHVNGCVALLRALNAPLISLKQVNKFNRWLERHEFGALIAVIDYESCKLNLWDHDNKYPISITWMFSERVFPVIQYIFHDPKTVNVLPNFVVSHDVGDKRFLDFQDAD